MINKYIATILLAQKQLQIAENGSENYEINISNEEIEKMSDALISRCYDPVVFAKKAFETKSKTQQSESNSTQILNANSFATTEQFKKNMEKLEFPKVFQKLYPGIAQISEDELIRISDKAINENDFQEKFKEFIGDICEPCETSEENLGNFDRVNYWLKIIDGYQEKFPQESIINQEIFENFQYRKIGDFIISDPKEFDEFLTRIVDSFTNYMSWFIDEYSRHFHNGNTLYWLALCLTAKEMDCSDEECNEYAQKAYGAYEAEDAMRLGTISNQMSRISAMLSHLIVQKVHKIYPELNDKILDTTFVMMPIRGGLEMKSHLYNNFFQPKGPEYREKINNWIKKNKAACKLYKIHRRSKIRYQIEAYLLKNGMMQISVPVIPEKVHGTAIMNAIDVFNGKI